MIEPRGALDAPGAARAPRLDLAAGRAGGRERRGAARSACCPMSRAVRAAEARGTAGAAPTPRAAARSSRPPRPRATARDTATRSWRCSIATCCPPTWPAARRLLQLRVAQLARAHDVDVRAQRRHARDDPRQHAGAAAGQHRAGRPLRRRPRFPLRARDGRRLRGRRLDRAGRGRGRSGAARPHARSCPPTSRPARCPLSAGGTC